MGVRSVSFAGSAVLVAKRESSSNIVYTPNMELFARCSSVCGMYAGICMWYTSNDGLAKLMRVPTYIPVLQCCNTQQQLHAGQLLNDAKSSCCA